jgi:hypothetical protein
MLSPPLILPIEPQMRVIVTIIVLFLNFFCKLASAQWNDDALLLREPTSQEVSPKKKKVKTRTSVQLENKKNPEIIDTEVRKPNQVLILPDVAPEETEERPETIVDMWAGFREVKQSSRFAYNNISGGTPTVGVKASLSSSDWSWYFLYDTGFYYQIAKNPLLRLRDENLQIGFLKRSTGILGGIYYGLSYFDNQIVNENQNTDFVGNKKSGIAFLLQLPQSLDESTSLIYGLSVSPIVNYKEMIYQNSIRSGDSATAMTNAIQFGVVEKLDESNSLLINTAYSWTQVQFSGSTSVIDPVLNESIQGLKVREENISIQIGYRWIN